MRPLKNYFSVWTKLFLKTLHHDDFNYLQILSSVQNVNSYVVSRVYRLADSSREVPIASNWRVVAQTKGFVTLASKCSILYEFEYSTVKSLISHCVFNALTNQALHFRNYGNIRRAKISRQRPYYTCKTSWFPILDVRASPKCAPFSLVDC